MTLAVVLCASDLAHGIVERQAEDLDVEVNGVAGEVAFRLTPVAVFDDETGIGAQKKIAHLVYTKTAANAFEGVTSHELSSLTSQEAKDWVKGISESYSAMTTATRRLKR